MAFGGSMSGDEEPDSALPGDVPPFDYDSVPDEPPPERTFVAGVTLGSGLSFAAAPIADGLVELGKFLEAGLGSVEPGLVELARLGSTDLAALGDVERVDALLAIERHGSWLEALRQRLLGLISAGDLSLERWCVEEVGAALRVPGGAARTRLKNAEQLCERLPAVLDALTEGQIAPAQATAIAEASFQLPDEVLPAYSDRILARAPEQSLAQTKQSARRAVIALDPGTAEQRHERARTERHMRIAPGDHGMAWLMSLLPAEEARAVYARLDAVAHTTRTVASDGRTLDQLRADSLVTAILTDGSGAAGVAGSGLRPTVSVVVPLSALLGDDDQPGWLNGHGAISAGHARRIAHDPTGTWRRLVTDPVSGQVLDYGTTRYRPPSRLAEHVITRDGECTFPHCTHQASNSDLDHIRPYPDGTTSAENLQPLHRRHHNAKTHRGWKAQRDAATGITTWTSPQGRSYRNRPPERWDSTGRPPTAPDP